MAELDSTGTRMRRIYAPKPARVVAGLRRNADGIWQLDVTVNGRRVQKSAETNELNEAKELRDKIRSDLWRQEMLGEKPVVLFEDACRECLAFKTLQQRKSLRTMRLRLAFFDGTFKGKPITSITRANVSEVVTSKLAGKALGTMNRHYAAMSTLLRFCEDKGWIDRAPRMSWFKEPAGRISYLTRAEAQRLIDACNSAHLRAMIRFALATGLRRGNINTLRWKNVEMDRRTAWIWSDEAKSGKSISIPLTDDAMAVLKGQKGQHDEYVFVWNGKPVMRSNTQSWAKLLKRASIRADFRFHDLRHTWATWHIMGGTPLHVLQKLGGWADYKMVLRYSHFDSDFLAGFAANAGIAASPDYGKALAPIFSETYRIKQGGQWSLKATAEPRANHEVGHA